MAFLERIGAQGVTFIVSVVLARILDPAVYGSDCHCLYCHYAGICRQWHGKCTDSKKDADEAESRLFFILIL